MARRNPPTVEGQVWLQQFNSHLARWVQSGMQSDASLTSMGESLEHLFRRCPDYADTIQSIALSVTFLARQHGANQAVIPLATVGLTAATVAQDANATARLSGLQALYLAEIHLGLERRFEGLDCLKRVRQELTKLPKEDHVAAYARALAAQQEGRLYELGLEHERAADAYLEAAQQAESLIDGKSNVVAAEVVTTAMGVDEAVASFLPMLQPVVTRELIGILVKSRLGLARATAGDVEPGLPNDEVRDAVLKAWAAVDMHGLPQDVAVTDLFQTIKPLTAREASTRVNKLVRWAKNARAYDWNDWRALLNATMAHRKSEAGDKNGAAVLYRRVESDVRKASPLVAALVRGYHLMDHASDEEESADLADDFMMALALVRRTEHGPLQRLSLQFKALLDEPVAAAIRWSFDRFAKTGSKQARRHLGLLADSLRQRRWLPLDLETYEPSTPMLHRAVEAYQMVLDHLLRIAQALRRRPGTAALILQAVADDTLFLCITASDAPKPVVGHLAGHAYRTAARRLAETAIRAMGKERDSTALREAGRALFRALPKPVQTLIRDNDTLLISPDLRADEDSVPFELMHDGKEFLGLSKVIARLGSLRDMCRAVEPRRAGQGKMRALVVGVDQVPGRPALEFAQQETSDLRSFLVEHNWDAPAIAASRVTAEFVVDRLKYVSLLHVAAHGEVSTGDEAILLSQGRLVVEDLLRKRFPRMPFVYLNTCLLAHARYLGGGASQGIAHTMFELGAPAVIANLSPVYDKMALDLSRAFYRYALEHPVGEALRRARLALAQSDIPAAQWGTTVLIGDPGHRLDPDKSATERDDVTEVLDAYMTLGPEKDSGARKEAFTRLIDAIMEDPTRIRHAGALAIVEVLSKLDYSAPESDEESLERLIAVADELGHMPAMTLLRAAKANHLLETQAPSTVTIEAIDDALLLLEALRDEGTAWEGVRQKFLAGKKPIEMREAGLERQFRGDWSDRDKDAANALMDVLAAVQADQETNVGKVSLRPNESSLPDIAWNAIVIAYPNRFEDMREEAAYARELARKLVGRGFLPEPAFDSAHLLLAGLLHDLWGRQHSTGLTHELVQGWSGTIVQAVADLSSNWAPPGVSTGFRIVSGFPRLVEETLEFLGSCSWEDVYNHLDKRFDQLGQEAQSLLARVATEASNELAGCYAWVLGTIVVRNTFSPLDGSVPESIGERMNSLATVLWTGGQGYLATYLEPGFASVRNAEWDELQRWKSDITPAQYEKIRKGEAPQKGAFDSGV